MTVESGDWLITQGTKVMLLKDVTEAVARRKARQPGFRGGRYDTPAPSIRLATEDEVRAFDAAMAQHKAARATGRGTPRTRATASQEVEP